MNILFLLDDKLEVRRQVSCFAALSLKQSPVLKGFAVQSWEFGFTVSEELADAARLQSEAS